MKKSEHGYDIRTDLAIEARELVNSDDAEADIDGVKFSQDEANGITVTWVEVTDERGARQMGKPIGNYVTVECEAMKENDVDTHEEIIKILADKLGRLHKLHRDGAVLVVGLGNWYVTPDALGPKVISKILVTRHISGSLPHELIGAVRPVSAISPGVMGLTGIETGEIIKGVTERVKPDLVIAVDALAARKTNRINATVQLSDTGISPGAGVGNKRMALTEETLGVPIVAIGVPTVVDAATLVNDTLDRMLSSMMEAVPRGSDFFKMLANLESDEKYKLITDILDPYAGNMFVTPKEVDAVVERLSNIIANSINIALHPGIDATDINRYMH
jgi:spore protease